MFRMNRGRVIGILLTGFIIYFLFLASSDSGDFRKRTEEGLSRKHSRMQGDLSDEAFRAQTNEKLNDILAKQEDRIGQRPLRVSDEGTGPAAKGSAEDEITGVAGRKTMQRPNKEKPKYPVGEKQENIQQSSEDEGKSTKPVVSSDPGKDLAREKLQEYLKKPRELFQFHPNVRIHTNTDPLSCHLLQILLPPLQTRQTPSPRPLQNRPNSSRRRTRPIERAGTSTP